MTLKDQIAPGLLTLLDRMRELAAEMTPAMGYNCGFNAVLVPAGADASYLQLVDNGEEYSCVCEAPEDQPLYDIWTHRRELLHVGLDLEQAAQFLLKAYLRAKLRRVVERRQKESHDQRREAD